MKSAKQITVWAASALGWVLFGCGGATSIDERWDSDAAPALPGNGAPASGPRDTFACAAAERVQLEQGYLYATGPNFWLGSQSHLPLRVDGPGLFATREAFAPHGTSFTPALDLRVGPDGTLEDERGDLVLGYPPSASAGGPCVGPLRAPIFAPPRPTAWVSLWLNLDPRNVVLTFDILEPDTTSNFSTTANVFDSAGGEHYMDIYFGNQGDGLFLYHVVFDGGDLEGGTPGTDVEVSSGALQFTADGVLDTATTPELSVNFSRGAVPNQAIVIDFGPDITNDGGGHLQVTSFADYDIVHSLSVDGHGAGTGSHVSVDTAGEVMVSFDNGGALVLGKLALARFARESALATDQDGRLRATPRSGPPQFGNALRPGRGSVQSAVETGGTPAAPVLDGSGLEL